MTRPNVSIAPFVLAVVMGPGTSLTLRVPRAGAWGSEGRAGRSWFSRLGFVVGCGGRL